MLFEHRPRYPAREAVDGVVEFRLGQVELVVHAVEGVAAAVHAVRPRDQELPERRRRGLVGPVGEDERLTVMGQFPEPCALFGDHRTVRAGGDLVLLAGEEVGHGSFVTGPRLPRFRGAVSCGHPDGLRRSSGAIPGR
jgi:hypothetical protein